MTFSQSNNDENSHTTGYEVLGGREGFEDYVRERIRELQQRHGTLHQRTMRQIDALLPPSLKLCHDESKDITLCIGLLEELRACREGELDLDALPHYYQALLDKVDVQQDLETDDN